MKKQVIYSRYEYPLNGQTTTEFFAEIKETIGSEFNEDGAQVGGAAGAVKTASQRAIILTYSEEVDSFLRLKFCNRSDVQYSSVRTKEKE